MVDVGILDHRGEGSVDVAGPELRREVLLSDVHQRLLRWAVRRLRWWVTHGVPPSPEPATACHTWCRVVNVELATGFGVEGVRSRIGPVRAVALWGTNIRADERGCAYARLSNPPAGGSAPVVPVLLVGTIPAALTPERRGCGLSASYRPRPARALIHKHSSWRERGYAMYRGGRPSLGTSDGLMGRLGAKRRCLHPRP